MLHEEVARFSELSGEDAHSTSISRIGGYLDGYEKGREDGIQKGEKNMSDIVIRNVIASLQEIKTGYGNLDGYIEQLKMECRH